MTINLGTVDSTVSTDANDAVVMSMKSHNATVASMESNFATVVSIEVESYYHSLENSNFSVCSFIKHTKESLAKKSSFLANQIKYKMVPFTKFHNNNTSDHCLNKLNTKFAKMLKYMKPRKCATEKISIFTLNFRIHSKTIKYVSGYIN